MQNQTERHRAHKRRRISQPQPPSQLNVRASIRKLRQREPISATLILDEPDGPDGADDLGGSEGLGALQYGVSGRSNNIKAKGEIGILSEDLFAELFPSSLDQKGNESGVGDDQIFHVAICPWLPNVLCTPQTARWTIIPVKKARVDEAMTGVEGRRHSTLKVSSNSIAGNSVLRNVERRGFLSVAESTGLKVQQSSEISTQIKLVDVVPIELDTVFVRIDAEALRKLNAMQAKYGGGFAAESGKNASKKKPRKEENVHTSNANSNTATNPTNKEKLVNEVEEDEAQWEDAVRNALKAPRVIRTGDLLPLPLPAHPVTHVPPPPAKVLACETVSQGIIMSGTRIVMIKGGVSEGADNALDTALIIDRPNINNYKVDSNPEKGVVPDDLFNSETSDTDKGDLSDDSEDIFSLSSLPLASQSPGFSSSLSYATSQPVGSLADGVASPVSVASAFTTSTVRPGSAASAGRTLRAQGLLRAIPNELLQPPPSSDDDEEVRVYVEADILVKLQCFSGDWVSMEPTKNHGDLQQKMGVGVSEGLMQKHAEGPTRRAVKLFSLPGGHLARKNKQKHSTTRQRDRKSSFTDASLVPPEPIAYLSPILLASIGEPSHIRISPIASTVASKTLGRHSFRKSSIKSSSLPPFAKEVTLLKLASPLSTDKALQPSLFAGLRKHFEKKRRIVKDGDLVGIAFDESLGRALYDGSGTEEGTASNNELLLAANKGIEGLVDEDGAATLRVAWFRIGHTGISPSEGSDEEDDGNSNVSLSDKEDIWGGVVCIDASNTKMVQAGSEVSRLPSTLTNSWQYYMGTRKLPANNIMSSVKDLIISHMPTPHVSSLRHRVRQLLQSATSERAVYFDLPPSTTLLTSTQRHTGKATLAIQACEDLGLHVFSIDAFDIVAEGSGGADVKSEGLLKARAERAFSCGVHDTVLLIRHIEALDAERMVNALKEIIADSRAIIFTTTEVEKVPENVRSLFTNELEIGAPDEVERERLLRDICQNYGLRLAHDVNLANIALKTAALVAGDLVDLVERALVAKRERLENLACSISTNDEDTKEKILRPFDSIATTVDVELAGGDPALSVTKADFETAVSAARKTFADAIGAPKIPNVSWSDVGGLAHVKSAVMETIHLPLSRPELFAKGLKKRSGILFYGPPGTGKTLVAKAIATEFSLNFFSVKGPELLNMYIGESEANVRRVFQRARDARPCVVFFDELDSVAPKRGNQGDSGGVMDRIVSQLLSELDGMSGGDSGGGTDVNRGGSDGAATGSSGVFVIGATNRPDLLDQALLRPGRFDKMLYLGIADTHEKQMKIIEALTRKFTLSPSLSLRNVASTLPFTYTGADLYALCSDAMLKAITRQSALIDAKVRAYNKSLKSNESKINSEGQPGRGANNDGKSPISVAWYFDHVATAEDIAVTVTEADFHAAKAELVPSVSAEELAYYEKVKETFEGPKEESGKIRRDGEQQSFGGNGKGKGKGKLIERSIDSEDTSTLAVRSTGLTNGMTDRDGGGGAGASAGNGIGSSSGTIKAKGAGADPTNAATTLGSDYADSRSYAEKDDTVSTGKSASESETNTGVPIAIASGNDVGRHESGNQIQTETDADADAGADSSSSDTSNFDDAQSKVSRVNGLLSRSNSNSGTSSDSDDSDSDADAGSGLG